jgi:cell division septum initiation protein DivIVA
MNDDSGKSSDEEEDMHRETTRIAIATRCENEELKKRIEELQRQIDMATTASATSSTGTGSNEDNENSGTVGMRELPDAKKQLVATFVKNMGWKICKFVPNDSIFTNSKTLLPQLLVHCHITSAREKQMYEEEAKRVFRDDTNQRRHNVKVMLKKKYKSKCMKTNQQHSSQVMSLSQSLPSALVQRFLVRK